jgi:adenylate cyclase
VWTGEFSAVDRFAAQEQTEALTIGAWNWVAPRRRAVQSERVERRLAAILAADVVGYSRLMGQDEAGTLARLQTLRRELIDLEITEHKGRVVKTTGDGILIEFPSVVEAVACAVAMQRGMHQHNAATPQDQRMEFRVGINLGDVIVEDGDIHGEGVNVTARLEALAEPGGICVSALVHDQVQGRLDCAFEDMGEQGLKNIARPVRVYRVRPERKQGISVGPTLALPDKPSIAVLPFQNMSGDPEQEYFADGMVEEIITALSRYPSLFVIARNSCFSYKGSAVGVKLIGRELGVRYVLEGGVRKAGNRIRVTSQLVETETGKNAWAERYDRDLADIFALQDEITQAVTTAIAPAIADAERRMAMRKPPGSLDAWGAYQRGLWHVGKFNGRDNALAQGFFRRTVELDPSFSGGYGGLALAQVEAAGVLQTSDLSEVLRSAEALARQAVAVDGGDAEARACLCNALWMRGDYEGALAEAERALAMSPNLARGHANLGAALIFSGRPKEGIEALGTSIRLDPRDPLLPNRLNLLALGRYFSHEYDAAIEAAKDVIHLYPDYPLPYRWLAAALGQLGQTAKARQALEKAIAVAPALFGVYVRNRVPWHRPEDHIHMLEGLRKAGLDEE